MICEPSGDQAGVMFVPRKRGKETSLPVSREYMQICALVRPAEGAKQEKAMREASGDQRGVRAINFREVSGCWVEPSESMTPMSLGAPPALTKPSGVKVTT